MYRRAVLRAATAAFLLLWCMSGVWADAMVVSGRKVASRVPFVISGDDIFAPLLPALQHLGAKSEILPEAIKITTSAQQEVLISRTRPEATRDGVLRDMPGLPQKKGSELLLPAKAVGSLLGCNVRWDESASILFIHPWVRKFTLETLPDRWRITAAAEGPMTYESGRVQEGTPRLFVDLLNVDLANIPSELKAEEGGLRAARISQKCLSPAPEGDVVRLVVELAEWKPYHIQLGEGRRTLQIDFPLPGMQELPLEAPPVVLSGVSFRRVSPRLAVVTIATFGKAVIQSGADPEPPTVWVDLANADNRIPELPPKVEDRLISGLAIATSPARPGAQRLTISLTSAAEHLASSRPGEVRVLLGKLELSGLCVVIDPGHGGHDTGAIGRSGLLEKDVNLDIAQRVGRRLEAMNVKVRLTRTEDSPVIPWNRSDREEHRQELLARCAIADDCGANLFVSIHAARTPGRFGARRLTTERMTAACSRR